MCTHIYQGMCVKNWPTWPRPLNVEPTGSAGLELGSWCHCLEKKPSSPRNCHLCSSGLSWSDEAHPLYPGSPPSLEVNWLQVSMTPTNTSSNPDWVMMDWQTQPRQGDILPFPLALPTLFPSGSPSPSHAPGLITTLYKRRNWRDRSERCGSWHHQIGFLGEVWVGNRYTERKEEEQWRRGGCRK
jgi:hypothetical protein